MELFIGNIPKKMNAFELQRLVNRALSSGGLVEALINVVRRKGKIRRLEFDVVTEVKVDKIVRYGKAIVEPDPAAKNIIKKLNNFPCRGNRLNVREFGHRSYNNERRSPGNSVYLKRSTYAQERRCGERRVSTTEIQS